MGKKHVSALISDALEMNLICGATLGRQHGAMLNVKKAGRSLGLGAWILRPGAWRLLGPGAWGLAPEAGGLRPEAWGLEPRAWRLRIQDLGSRVQDLEHRVRTLVAPAAFLSTGFEVLGFQG